MGKCYIRNFDCNKKFEWKKIDCEKVKKLKEQSIKVQSSQKTKEQIIKETQQKIKLKKYQEKLLKLGYDVEVNAVLDAKTMNAHNKYLKQTKKETKRKRRAARRKVRSR